jgi:hypothetical protein
MIEQIQPMMFMMLSSMKNNNDNCITQYLTLLLLLLPIICKTIPFDDIKDYFKKYFNKNTNFISINISSHEVPVIRTCSTTPITKLIYSKDFLSIIHYLTTNKIENLESLTEIISSNSELDIRSYFDDDRENKFIYIPIHNNRVLISENEKIYFELNDIDNKNDEENKDDKKTVKIAKKKNFIIILSISNKILNGIDILKKFIENCRESYDLFHNKNKDDNKQYIFEYKNCEKSDSILELKFKQYLMEHNKDLSVNIFFEDKDKLINYIKPFIYDQFEKYNIGEEKYKRSGFTFKAGILFYGSPGCGKTSTIKAILKYTNRHGIIINLNRVKTCEELELIFRNRTINGREMNGKQLCYILEDCDAFDDDIIKSRKKDEEDFKKYNDNIEASQLAKLMDIGTITVQNMIKKDEDSVNLSCFLNILDGIIELHGVMIIMTTNHPEKIDEALIRPGRFDFKYEFKRASKKVVREMIQFKFELSDKEIEQYIKHMNIKDEILSPAEIQSICFKNNDIKKCIDEIVLASQK